MHVVHNARVQLLATLLNTMAGASFAVGVAAPIAATFFYGSANIPVHSIVIGAIIWLVAASALHALALRVADVTDLHWFAFVILPVGVVALGGLATWLGRRLIPSAFSDAEDHDRLRTGAMRRDPDGGGGGSEPARHDRPRTCFQTAAKPGATL
jgi:hypothetical protein